MVPCHQFMTNQCDEIASHICLSHTMSLIPKKWLRMISNCRYFHRSTVYTIDRWKYLKIMYLNYKSPHIWWCYLQGCISWEKHELNIRRNHDVICFFVYCKHKTCFEKSCGIWDFDLMDVNWQNAVTAPFLYAKYFIYLP